MKKFLWMISGFVLFLLVTGISIANFGKIQAQEEADQNPEKRKNVIRMRASDLMGEQVRNKKGEEYGTLGDIILHNNGTIDYVILLHGGILGLGKKLVPIPWKRVLDTENEGVLIIDVDDELLKNAPNFSEEEWEKFEKDEWNEEIEKYYGY